VNAHLPHVRRHANRNLDDPGLGTTSIITNAKTPWEAVANSVGSDIVNKILSYPLSFRQLEEKYTRPNAPFANGYFTRYCETINCSLQK
jgi:hypothetical protein